jgi:hypothetical protein
MAQDIFGQKTAIAPFANDNKVRLVISGLNTNDKIFLTGVKGEVKPNYQLQYAVGPGRYINSFTHRLSLFVIEGKYVLANCNGPFDAVTDPEFFQFYKERNISNSDEAVQISYSGIVLTGYLVALTTNRHNQEAVDGFSFTLTFLGAVDGLENTPSTSQIGAANAGYSNPRAYVPGKTGPGRAAENTTANSSAISSTPFRGNVQSLTDRNVRAITGLTGNVQRLSAQRVSQLNIQRIRNIVNR